MYKRYKGLSIDDIKRHAAGRWPDILASVCGLTTEQLDPRVHSPCPKCGGADRYRAFDNVDETGGLICNQCHNGNTTPKSGDGLAAVMWLNGVDFKEALRLVADYLGIQSTDQRPTAAAPPKAADKAKPYEWMLTDQNYLNILRNHGQTANPTLADSLGVSTESLQALDVGYVKSIEGSHWTFPERKADGTICGLNRRFADGQKKLFKGHKRGLYFADNWADATGPVLIVEGGSDTAAGITLGLSVIGRPSAKVPREVLPELVTLLKSVPADRDIIIVAEHDQKPDGDWPGRTGAVDTATKLTRQLGRPVQWALPPTEHKDLRSWRQANPGRSGAEFLASLTFAGADSFNDNEERCATTLTLCEIAMRREATLALCQAPDDPYRLANLFVAKHPELKCWQGDYFDWDGICYQKIDGDELKAELNKLIEHQFLADWREENDTAGKRRQQTAMRGDTPKDEKEQPKKKVTVALITNVLAALQAVTILPSSTPIPTWLTESQWQPDRCIVTKNGIVAIDSPDMLIEATPEFFATNALPYQFDPLAECPRWRKFLECNLECDEERIRLLQEWFGYCLTPSTKYQKFLLLYGEGGTGKSVTCAVLRAVLGEENCSAVPLESFADRFSLYQTVGKLANVAADTNEIDKAAEGRIKSFTSGDRMQLECKYKQPFEAVPTAKLILATNTLPRFSDRSNGIWRRVSLIPFDVVISEADKVRGMDTPTWWLDAGELPGILNWSIEGLLRLEAQGGFTNSDRCSELIDDYRNSTNPAREFLSENYQERPGGFIETAEIYESYVFWCKKNGYQPLHTGNFGKEVLRLFQGAKKERIRVNGSRVCRYTGIHHQIETGDF